MSIVLDDLTARLDTLTKAVLSQPLARIGCSRVTIRPLSLHGKAFFQRTSNAEKNNAVVRCSH